MVAKNPFDYFDLAYPKNGQGLSVASDNDGLDDGVTAEPTGGRDATPPSISQPGSHQLLRHLRREFWSHPALFLADRALFKEVRRSLHVPQGERPQVVAANLGRSTISCGWNHEISKRRGCVMDPLCKLLLWSCLVAYWRRQPRRSHQEAQ